MANKPKRPKGKPPGTATLTIKAELDREMIDGLSTSEVDALRASAAAMSHLDDEGRSKIVTLLGVMLAWKDSEVGADVREAAGW